jgi:hypothetical protein
VQQHDYQLAKAAGAVADAPTIGQWLQYFGPAVLALIGLLAPGSKDGAGKLLEIIKALFGSVSNSNPVVAKPAIRPTEDDDDEGDDDIWDFTDPSFLAVRVTNYGEEVSYLAGSEAASNNLHCDFAVGGKQYRLLVSEQPTVEAAK